MTTSRPRATHPVTGARPDDLRRTNRTAVLRTLHRRGATTRAVLGVELALNRSTIKSVVDELADDGLVSERLPEGRTGAGRPSMVVQPVPEAVWAVAVQVAVGWLVVEAIGLGGTVLGRRGGRPVRVDVGPAEVAAEVGSAVDALTAEVGRPPVGLGVAVPGLARAADGTVRRAPNLGWRDAPLGALLAARTGLEVRVGNEADLGALAEHVRGCARDVEDLLYLVVDVGVGGGVISGGSSVAGAGGYAGEVGHMVVRRDGRACRCGSRGCWETEIGEVALARAVGLTGEEGRPALQRRLTELQSGGHPRPTGLTEYAAWLSMGVGNLVNLLDPRTVVFGGVLADALPLVVEDVRTHVANACLLPRELNLVSILPTALGSSGPLLGAAELVFAAVLDRC